MWRSTFLTGHIVQQAIVCSRLSVVGDGEKRESERKNEGGLRRLLALVLPRFFLARFRSSPTTESLEQAKEAINRLYTYKLLNEAE